MTKDADGAEAGLWVEPGARSAPPVFREVVAEHGAPPLGYKPRTYEEIQKAADRRSVHPQHKLRVDPKK